MKRREFISLLGGAAAWPLAARAMQSQGTLAQAHTAMAIEIGIAYRTEAEAKDAREKIAAATANAI